MKYLQTPQTRGPGILCPVNNKQQKTQKLQ